eukprot:6717506-Pyramimonas_sp.AAC.1
MGTRPIISSALLRRAFAAQDGSRESRASRSPGGRGRNMTKRTINGIQPQYTYSTQSQSSPVLRRHHHHRLPFDWSLRPEYTTPLSHQCGFETCSSRAWLAKRMRLIMRAGSEGTNQREENT